VFTSFAYAQLTHRKYASQSKTYAGRQSNQNTVGRQDTQLELHIPGTRQDTTTGGKPAKYRAQVNSALQYRSLSGAFSGIRPITN